MNRIHKNFTDSVLNWSICHGRHDLPWQNPRCAYRIWISEIMLQQTSVKTVVPYFMRFIERFPTIDALAAAHDDDVLSLWSGLGYYHRARHLLKTAQIITQQGTFPNTPEALEKLPGIGPSTAAAIASLAFDQPAAILDGNVKRVLSRYFKIDGQASSAAVKKKLWSYAKACMPEQHCAAYTQAIMDFGATLCTQRRPSCSLCPLNATCLAYQDDVVALYPAKAIKRVLPIKQQQFILLSHDHQIYLEKNPPTGLWGGLWCLLPLDTSIDVHTYLEQHHAGVIESCTPLPPFRHTFSHFHLDLHPVHVVLEKSSPPFSRTHGQWFSRNEWDVLGLATPVRRILLDVESQNTTQQSSAIL